MLDGRFFNFDDDLRCNFQFYILITQNLDHAVHAAGSNYMVSPLQGQQKSSSFKAQLLLRTIHEKVENGNQDQERPY